jgi:hypothetical protein
MEARHCAALAVASGLTAIVVATSPSSDAAGATGAVHVVQAVPGASVSVVVDGRQRARSAPEGDVIGPLSLSAGKHQVTFATTKSRMAVAVDVRAGSSSDVVLHLPASVSGRPVVNTYRTPRKSIGPGKARVLVAHTATVAPADVSVDGRIVFTNIANGEFATADLPAGTHRVALFPTGVHREPILGPLDVTLQPRTVTMVYAVGRPSNGSMKVIAHASRLAADGSVVPGAIATGSAGLVASWTVPTFALAR